MDTKELEQIIENHKHYLYKDVDGWETMQADLRGVNIRGADLNNASLRSANLSDANLNNADLMGADLRYVDLRCANLRYVDLRGALLKGADLWKADLGDANLKGANLRCADLRYVDLRYANLSYAILEGVDLEGANLEGANLWKANLRDAMNVPYIPMVCPEEGSFIGYKKASGKIVKLLIPEDAKRSSATTRKCRCNKAVVLAIYELDGSISNVTEVCSDRDSNFIYKINKEVNVDDFDNDRWNECSTGIHFFMQRHEAEEYMG